MKVSAVHFTSVKTPKVTANNNVEPRQKSIINPYKIADIAPITTAVGVGLAFAFFYKTGKLNGLKDFIKIG